MKKALFCRLFPLLLLTTVPAAALAESSVDSTTILRVRQDARAGFETQTLVPLTQYLGVDIDKLGDGNLSAHLYGWGRLDLDDSMDTVDNPDRFDGSLSYGYLQYRFNYANARARAGRFFVTEGIANELVDGITARTDLPYGFGVSAFGGATVHTVDIPGMATDGKGDGIFGGRVNYRHKGMLELGLSGLYESKAPEPAAPGSAADSFGSHRLLGGDIWLKPHNMVQISGHTSYNTETQQIAEHSYLLQVTPSKELVLAANFDEQNNRDYFYSSLLFANMIRNLGRDSRTAGASASYTLGKAEISGDFKHYSRETGKAQRFGGELRGTLLDNSVRTGFGYHYLRSSPDFAVAGSASGSFHEVRAYALCDTKGYFAALDAIGYFFKKPVENSDSAWELLGSLGYHLTPAFELSGDLSYGQNPQYDDELKGLLRVTYNMNTGKGGTK
ncbi:MAG: hypothetical protein A2075_14185 [Geobacteraceae bacterium GWC2_58_44]|nr:MAG: hypothetical protein A2075_14185 [Geobacteraceae bacterium GWC2_58_44]